MGGVYGFATACIAGVVASARRVRRLCLEQKGDAVANAIRVAVATAEQVTA